MEFRIADTFTDSLARLTGDEQKAVKTTAFDLQLDPTSPGMSFHKLAKAKDKRFWSVRVSSDLRLIVHRTPDSLLLCYVDHHDKAYAWAERRKLETHPTTGAAQLVEIRERVQEIVVPRTWQPPQPRRRRRSPCSRTCPTRSCSATVCRPSGWPTCGRPPRTRCSPWRTTCRRRPPRRCSSWRPEERRTGREPCRRPADPFEHPDARRRFRVMTDVDELARALEYPWERWTVFLHPAQRDLVERRFGGPARIAGSAGTGKTIVALHRAAHLARANPDARILLTTFSETLASALRTKLARLIGTEPRLRERIDVDALDTVARRLHDRMLGRAEVASRDVMRDLVREAARESVGPEVLLRLPAVGVERGRGRLAARLVGGVSRRRPPRAEDEAAGEAAAGALGDLRAGPEPD